MERNCGGGVMGCSLAHHLCREGWTDLDQAMRMAQGLRAGQVRVNEWYAGGVETPFGGYGRSGYGREKGREALWELRADQEHRDPNDPRDQGFELTSVVSNRGAGVSSWMTPFPCRTG